MNTCLECGKTFKGYSQWQKFCDDCIRKVPNEEYFKKIKGGEKEMEEKKESNLKHYDDSIKKKAVAMYKEGKAIIEIVKELNGPKKKSIERWIDKATEDKGE